MRPERSQGHELEPSLVEAFVAAFIPRSDMYPIQRHDGRYVTVRKPLTASLVESHLLGRITLGAYALNPDSRARWLCYDADSGVSWTYLQAMALALLSDGVPAYLEQSRRGGHLWLFLPTTPPVSGASARQFGRQLLQTHHVENVELFPKQDRLTTGPGSLVRLPLGRHRKDGRRYHFIQPDGTPLSPTIREQISLLAFPERTPDDFFYSVLADAKKLREQHRRRPSGHGSGETLSDRIKDRLPVYDFVSQYVQLDERGTGYCPFHDDQHKSFSVNRDQNYWNCFAGCGGGSIIDFWMKWREQQGKPPDFTATLKDLSDMLF